MREEGERMRKDIEMAIARPQKGIESWHKEGFEARVLTEVRSVITNMEKTHKSEMNELRAEMRHAKKKIEHINGFYTWLLEVYPETVAQYKALMDLQKVGETI
jgi:hypothetical protein